MTAQMRECHSLNMPQKGRVCMKQVDTFGSNSFLTLELWCPIKLID